MKIKRLLFALGMISFMVGVMPRSNFASADQVNTGQLNINVLDSVDSSGIQGAYFQVRHCQIQQMRYLLKLINLEKQA